jgi:hypothetical protein
MVGNWDCKFRKKMGLVQEGFVIKDGKIILPTRNNFAGKAVRRKV